ncbi:MAG: TlpA family protein disulfide reductase [Acidibacillus sp.]|nr:TlpA family protein disulfide reductase [Acidibacillus sp.]
MNQDVDPGAPLHGRPAPDFSLVNQAGKTVSLHSMRGKTVVLAFMNSEGQTVSPLMAIVLRNFVYDLGSYQHDVQVIAVNTNPVARSVSAINHWSGNHKWPTDWPFLTGSTTALMHVWDDYAVSSQVIHGSLIEDTPVIYVISPSGKEEWLYLNSNSSQAPVVAAQVQELMNHVAPLLPGHVSPQQFSPARELQYLPQGIGPSSSTTRFFSLPSLIPSHHDTTMTQSSVTVGRGGGPILLEFFATWCPDCQEEFPILRQYASEQKMHPVWPKLIAIDLRQSESSLTHVEHYIQEQQLNFPVALDNKGAVSDLYGVTGLPTQVLVSGSGHILWYHQGLLTYADLMKHINNMST